MNLDGTCWTCARFDDWGFEGKGWCVRQWRRGESRRQVKTDNVQKCKNWKAKETEDGKTKDAD